MARPKPLDGLAAGFTKENAALKARKFLEDELPKLEYPEGQFNGRGVVIVAGGPRYSICAWICLRALRHVGCTLPVEMWYLGPGEYNAAFDQLCQTLGAVHVDARKVQELHPHGHLAGWELKPYAITWSRFDEVLLLDADNIPVIDPTFLFETEQYLRDGSIFWPDYRITRPTNEEWQVYGRPYQPGHQLETGQAVVDKARAWAALQLANWYSERSQFFYRFVLGDTGIFYHAWPMTATPYAIPSRLIHTLPGTMCQHDFQGRRLFQHRNFQKWQLELDFNKPRGDDFHLQAECFRWIEELSREWSPAGQTLPTEADKAAVLAACHKWRYTRVGYDARDVTLRADGTFAAGGAACERFWTVRDGRLKIACTDGRLTMDLEPDGAGGWRGKWLINEGMPATLRPAS